jgi:hypothetical protein
VLAATARVVGLVGTLHGSRLVPALRGGRGK